jgi:glycosyltransferase involved in cell wall biosynthesis
MPGVEDFGIVPVEAMACGRPAVVCLEGGGSESVVAGETGLVFDRPTGSSLREAVDCLEGMRFNTRALRARAEKYGRPVFEERIRAFVDKGLASRPQASPDGAIPE